MITTDFLPGSPCWIELGVPDTGAAAAFYRTVLNWEYEPAPAAVGGYGHLRLDGRLVAGLGPLTEEDVRPAWTVYFHTPDVEATAEAAEAAGGTVRLAPTAVADGRTAHLTDPLGARFAVWQPGEGGGVQAVDEAGALCWVELCTTDAAAAKEFYGGLFGWRTEDTELPGGGRYTVLTPAQGERDRAHGGLVQLPAGQLTLGGGHPWWHPVFAVSDCDAAVRRVVAGGGTVQTGPEDTPGVGRLAVCLDPWAADFVLLRPVEEAV